MIKDKDYFVLTTNVDHCFQKASVYTQGDDALFQCSVPCHNKTYDNRDAIPDMYARQHDGRIPSELVPRCPVCGQPMTMNLRSDNLFVEDKGWHAAAQYNDFVRRHANLNLVLLEIGVSGNTPVIIKYPFQRMTTRSNKAFFVCINYGKSYCPPEIRKRSVCINGDADQVISGLPQNSSAPAAEKVILIF